MGIGNRTIGTFGNNILRPRPKPISTVPCQRCQLGKTKSYTQTNFHGPLPEMPAGKDQEKALPDYASIILSIIGRK